MQQQDHRAFAECMALLQETFTPEKPISKKKMEIYFQIFEDMTIEEFQKACMRVCRSKSISTFPLPAEIREASEGDMVSKAQLALAKLEKAVDTLGANYSVEFNDPVIHAVVVRLGGWEWITTQQRDEWKWIRKDFERLYGIYSKLNPKQIDAPERLVGRFEANCNIRGEDFGVLGAKYNMLQRIGEQPEVPQIEYTERTVLQ